MNYDLYNQVVDFTISVNRKFTTIYTPSSVKEMYNSIMDIHNPNNEPYIYIYIFMRFMENAYTYFGIVNSLEL